jgi:subtilisin family serine protease
MRLAHKVATSAAVVGALLLLGTPIASSDTTGTTGPTETYLVLYKQQAVPADAATRIQKAGGSVVTAYDAIGVVVAQSNNSAFRTEVEADARVDGAAATTKFASKLDDGAATDADGGSPGDLPNAPATDSAETLFGLQWDMRQINTPQAHAITGGSPAVVAATLDTGLDFSHPDLAPNYDPTHSADCTSGAPTPLLPGNDKNGHGTHTAGTIAAAANGFGIVGVAPNVKLAGIKTGNDAGFFFPQAVICAFMFAGDTHVDVTNNSYFADPYLYNCRNDPVQRAIWKAEQRAIRYAQKQGVTVVSAAGNESDDLSHPTIDTTSPDDSTPVTRDVTNACVVVPVEVPGVIGVSAVGNTRQTDNDDDPNDYLKSYYSSYGVSAIDVTAPGGDFYYGRGTEGQPFGLVLSTWPANLPCSRSVKEDPAGPPVGLNVYCYLQGTSMASPHAAGLAALIISRYGDLSNPSNGKMRPGAVEAIMQQTANAQPCPTALPASGAPGSSLAGVPYSAITQTDGSPQTCQGGPGHNSWYGNGQIDAYAAVTKTAGNQ